MDRVQELINVLAQEEVIARTREMQREMIKEAGLEGELELTATWPVIRT